MGAKRKQSMFLLSGWLCLTLAGCGVFSLTQDPIAINLENNTELMEPPLPLITVGGQEVKPILGSYEWEVENEDGTITASVVDIAPPNELAKEVEPVYAQSEDELAIIFNAENQPSSLDLHIWEGSKKTVLEDDAELKDYTGQGPVVFEVYTEWFQGDASYVLVIDVGESKE